MALADYQNKRQITIDHNKIDATETDYPAMTKLYSDSSVSAWSVSTYAVDDIVKNNSAYYKCTTASTTKEPGVTTSWQDDWIWLGDEFDFSKIQSDGKDLRFTASDETTLLDYERELLETTTEPYQLVVHTRIPSVSSSVDTDYYMYYNYPSETVDGENKTGVWDSNFVMVQHMGTSLLDSTINGNDGTNNGTTLVNGFNGKARSFDGDNDYISLPTSVAITGDNPYTIQTLILGETLNDEVLVAWGTNSNNDATGLSVTPSTNSFIRNYWYANDLDGVTTLEIDKNYLLSANYNQTQRKVFINSNTDNSDTPGTHTATNNAPIVGAFGGGGSLFFNGIIDEIRISNTARSDSWIKADDANLRTWDLQSIGVEEFTVILATSIVNTSVFGSPSISFDQFIQATGIDNIQTFGSSTVSSGLLIATNSITNESYIGIPYIYFDQIINGQGFENETLFGELYLRNWKIVSKPTTIWTKKDDEITIWTKQ